MRMVAGKTTIGAVALALVLALAPAASIVPAQASEIRVIVNGTPVTSYDIQRRAAFLRLQQQGGNLQQRATEDMIDQVLRQKEMERLNVRIPEDEVSDAYANFARTNNLSTSQLDNILAQSGVTRAHFRDFIRAQMGWGQLVQARGRHEQGRMTEQEAVRRMLEQGGEKPSTTEYMLQQVIFVVPAAERGARLAQRRREAEQMRARFQSCETTIEFARGLLDVTVRDLGRVLAPQLPPDWENQIKATQSGQTTVVRDTDRGVEFIAVCSARQVSDDHVARLVFERERQGEGGADQIADTYMSELRDRAEITRR